MTKASDRQEGGDHYKTMGDFQPWDVLQHWLTPEEYRGYQKGVAIAYLARERQKGGNQDIKKAAHHLQRLIEALDEKAKPYVVPQAAMDAILGNPPFASSWIEWPGGECPVLPGTVVEYRMREPVFPNEGTFQDIARDLEWPHTGGPSDIIAYRIVTNG